jgi:hypothetical protein
MLVLPLMREGRALAATLIACLIFLTLPSCGKMGYDIVAHVGGSSFEIHRSTLDFNYESKESINGSGLFSRYSHIKGFGGVDAREDTSTTKASKLAVKSQLLLMSREGPVKFTVKAKSGVNTSYNESNIALTDSAHLEIDERWPVYFIWSKKISYFGRGIRARERYENNGDVVDSYTWSWKLSQDSLYRAYANRSLISADISPESVEISQRSNRSSMYNLNLNSVGSMTHLMVFKQGNGNSGDAYFSEDYAGEQKMAVKVKMDESLIKPDDEDSEIGMGCCT